MGTIWGVRKVQSNVPMATRTTKTPAFWGYPRRPIITYTIDSYWTPIQNKTKSNLQKNTKSCQIFQVFDFENNWAPNTPSEVG